MALLAGPPRRYENEVPPRGYFHCENVGGE
jgi:hypothetical protein